MAPYTTDRARIRVFSRYAASSALAAALSELAFLAGYGLGAIPAIATVIAWFAGAVPNYLLNRHWAWQHRGRVDGKRELLPYVTIVVATTAVAALVTTLVDGVVTERVTGATLRTLLVGAAYIGTYGAMFLLKFLLFDRYVFRNGRRGAGAGRAPS